MPPAVVPRTRTNTKTLASMVANDIEPDIGSVTAALQETNIDDRRHAIARIASTLASPIRTKTAQAIATSTLTAGTDAATIVAIARALVPPEFLKAAKAGQIQQNPAMQVIDALVRAARDLVLPPEHQDYLILIRPLHLRQAQEDLRQMNVGRLPQPLIDTFSGILPPPPAGSVEAFTMKCTLISMVLNTIAINALSQQLRRSVSAREVLAILWEEPGAVQALGIE